MQFFKYLISGVALASIFMLTGCATIVTGSNQRLNVQALDSKTLKIIPHAKCELKGNSGQIYSINGNPGSTEVNIKEGRLLAKCRKAGYKQVQIGVGQSFNAWTVADVIFWPTIFVDIATGAVEKYPSHVTVLMQKR